MSKICRSFFRYSRSGSKTFIAFLKKSIRCFHNIDSRTNYRYEVSQYSFKNPNIIFNFNFFFDIHGVVRKPLSLSKKFTMFSNDRQPTKVSIRNFSVFVLVGILQTLRILIVFFGVFFSIFLWTCTLLYVRGTSKTFIAFRPKTRFVTG